MPYPNNPDAAGHAAMTDDGARFLVVADGVGSRSRGEVAIAKDFGPGAQIQRLLDIGAVRRIDDELDGNGVSAHQTLVDAGQLVRQRNGRLVLTTMSRLVV